MCMYICAYYLTHGQDDIRLKRGGGRGVGLNKFYFFLLLFEHLNGTDRSKLFGFRLFFLLSCFVVGFFFIFSIFNSLYVQNKAINQSFKNFGKISLTEKNKKLMFPLVLLDSGDHSVLTLLKKSLLLQRLIQPHFCDRFIMMPILVCVIIYQFKVRMNSSQHVLNVVQSQTDVSLLTFWISADRCSSTEFLSLCGVHTRCSS